MATICWLSEVVVKGLDFLMGTTYVPGNEFGHHSSNRLNAQGQRQNIQNNQVTFSTTFQPLSTSQESWCDYTQPSPRSVHH